MMKIPGRKAGMALPLTLIVLLVAGALVALSFYFIENMMTTTQMKTDDELRLNAALAGVERESSGFSPGLTQANCLPSPPRAGILRQLRLRLSGTPGA